MRLGRAIGVFLDPGRVIIGVRSDLPAKNLAPLLTKFCQNLMWMNVESAEMVKHALNGYLALSITFTNELAVIAERIGANAADIERALRSDPRIGPNAYVKAGPAFAGGTLARDVQFLSSIAGQQGLKAPLINSIIASNRAHETMVARPVAPEIGAVTRQSDYGTGLELQAGNGCDSQIVIDRAGARACGRGRNRQGL